MKNYFAGSKVKNVSKFILIALAAIVTIVLAVAIPNFIRAHQIHNGSLCVSNLRVIDAAKHAWALENNKTTNDVPTLAELLPWLDHEFTNYYATNGVIIRSDSGIDGGIYTIGRVGESPSCLIDKRRVVYP